MTDHCLTERCLTENRLTEHFFRHEYGKLVATLSRLAGVAHLEAVEDAVQSALMSAVELWPGGGLPQNPSAWLFRVAHNNLLGGLRTTTRHQRLQAENREDHNREEQRWEGQPLPPLVGEVRDALLRMLFVCCDESVPAESQLVLALKTLCGFDTREIALRLFLSEANVYKRLSRARTHLRTLQKLPDSFGAKQYASRLPAVRRIVYLMFTEGHLSSHSQLAIRQELCDEALRLGTLLAEHSATEGPETSALLALMHLHSARLSSRQANNGAILLLEEQDRSAWDQEQIGVGMAWLARSASGNTFGRYHAEAGIAAEHCLSASLEDTCWEKIAGSYALLEELAPSPLHQLCRAVATAQWQGPIAGLAVLDDFHPPSWLEGSYLSAAVLADLHKRCGNAQEAKRYREIAWEAAPSPAIKEALIRRLSGN